MSGYGMDKRITSIIRWLERCRKSYKSGAIESALMDAECARADLEDLRLDVWEHVRDGYVPRRFRLGSVLCAYFLLPILMVMATPSPLSKIASQVAVVTNAISAVTATSAAIVTEPEIVTVTVSTSVAAPNTVSSTVANSIQKITPPANTTGTNTTKAATSKISPSKSASTTRAKDARSDGIAQHTASRSIQHKIPTVQDSNRNQVKPAPKPKQEIPTYDTMISLFQTGQRALKGN